ncbi:hypothetical protein Cgig2_005817 [Carnegiea gigantea]|uniref:GRPD C-terminal domain-containing protein n=1 Tax=Carnegiea gigantea TaxID=171969 RepID=A0A9Q1KP41_9CARY|nr:hypothetical protein Cgig2_005817 [Carnegiea gigantea]
MEQMLELGSLVVIVEVLECFHPQCNGSGGSRILPKDTGKGWSLVDSSWDLCPQSKPSKRGNMYELRGQKKVIVMAIKSDYETEYNRQEDEQNFITAVEFSPQHSYGKAIALFNLKSGFLEIKEDWFLTPGIISACILRNVLISKSGFKPTEMSKSDKYQASELHETAIICGGACGGGGGGCGGGCGGGRCRAGTCGGGRRCGGSCVSNARCGGVAVLVGDDNVVDLAEARPLGSSMKLAAHL